MRVCFVFKISLTGLVVKHTTSTEAMSGGEMWCPSYTADYKLAEDPL